MKQKVFIVEDERNNRDRLIYLVEEHFKNKVEVVGACGSVLESIEFLKTHNVDILLLDIELSDGQVFDLLNNINYKKYKLIFITGYSEHAIKAIKYAAVDYLLKPFNATELAEAMNRVLDNIVLDNPILDDLLVRKQFNVSDYLIINSTHSIEKIPIEKISHLSADGIYTHIFHEGKTTVSSKPIGIYEDILSRDLFNRCHKSYIVSRNFIKRIGKGRGLSLTLFTGSEIPVAVRKKEEFMGWFGQA